MIIERWTWKVKVGCEDEVIRLVKAAWAETGLTPRVCSYSFGPHDIVFSDLEFESEQDRRGYWAGVDTSGPALTEWYKKRPDVLESGHTRELLQVH